MTQQDAVLKLFLEGYRLDMDNARELTGTRRLSGVVKNLEYLNFVFDRESVKHETRFKTKGSHTRYWLNREATSSMLIKDWENRLNVLRGVEAQVPDSQPSTEYIVPPIKELYNGIPWDIPMLPLPIPLFGDHLSEEEINELKKMIP